MLTRPVPKKWRKLDGYNHLPEVVRGIEFRDVIRLIQAAT